jgi:hypothetical protein
VQSALTVTTTAAGTTAAGTTAAADASLKHIWSGVRGGAMLACLLFFGWPGRRRALTVLSILLCAFSLGGMMACGGSANGSAPAAGNTATGTTPDTYTVTFRAVDATTGTLTAQNSFTMSVN